MNPFPFSMPPPTMPGAWTRAARRSENGPFPEQFNEFPDWMPPQADTSALQQFQGQIPQLFGMRGVKKAYGREMDQMTARGQGAAASAGVSYANRAMQVGASPMGAGFAQAQAMLGVNAQRAGMQSDLARLQLQAKAGKAGALGGVASEMSRLAAQNTAQRTGYAVDQQRLAQRDNEFEAGREDDWMRQWLAMQNMGGGGGGAAAAYDPGAQGKSDLGAHYMSKIANDASMGNSVAAQSNQRQYDLMKRAGYLI